VLPKRYTALETVDLFGIRVAGSPAALDQPQTLRQKSEQHECREDLWPAEAFAREESAHEETASVLPWQRTVRETLQIDDLQIDDLRMDDLTIQRRTI